MSSLKLFKCLKLHAILIKKIDFVSVERIINNKTLISWPYGSLLLCLRLQKENDDHENAIMRTRNKHCTSQPRELNIFRKAIDLFLSLFFLSIFSQKSDKNRVLTRVTILMNF